MNKEIEKLNKQIIKIRDKIKVLQSECPHINLEMKYRSSTGNYDPHDDSWWIDGDCPDCGEHFFFDSDKDFENYKKFSKFCK